ncbi:MAG: 4Fe-4S binding protein [Dehalococcoidales bacterium]|nr:4Fe-4S binding protein [Dehalococcoidales bacterium]
MIIGILTGIGIACGVAIYMVYIKVPQKVKGLEKTEELHDILPGANCGACGYPGCFAYAQALAKDPSLMTKSPCAMVLQDPERLKRLEKALGISLDASAMSKKALVHCNSDSPVISDYSGVMTCKAAAQLLRGYKKCLYACLGLGDCVKVCPQGAIFIDPEKSTAVVNTEKCTGCGLCVKECPQNIIELVSPKTKIAFLCSYEPLKNIPGREKCSFGCIHCRKCFNACEYEAIKWNKEKAIPEFNHEKCTLCGKCIEACPQHTLIDFTRVRKETELISSSP